MIQFLLESCVLKFRFHGATLLADFQTPATTPCSKTNIAIFNTFRACLTCATRVRTNKQLIVTIKYAKMNVLRTGTAPNHIVNNCDVTAVVRKAFAKRAWCFITKMADKANYSSDLPLNNKEIKKHKEATNRSSFRCRLKTRWPT